MSDDPSFLAQLGIRLPDLIAGFAGGVVNSFVFSKSSPFAIIGSVIVGAFTANYLSQPIGHYLGTSAGASAFVVGLAGMAICQGIVDAAKSWRPFNPKGTSDADRS